MQLIKPIEIASKIMCLIEEAEEFVVIVSPYYNFNNWRKLNRVFEHAMKRKVRFDFFVREGQEESIRQLRDIGITAKEITRLHAKIYFNEKEAIISSMNLNQSSDNDSLDIAMQTQTDDEYQSIVAFHKKYIEPKASKNDAVNLEKWVGQLDQSLSNIFKREPWLEFDEMHLTIKGDNNYEVFIANDQSNMLRINCVLSGKEFDFVAERPALFSSGKFQIELQKGTERYYSLIWGTSGSLGSRSLGEMVPGEDLVISEMIISFVKQVEEMKTEVRELSKAKKI